MKAYIQSGLLKLSDPRVVRILMIGLTLMLTLLSQSAVISASNCPGGSTGGCDGG